MTRAVVPGRVPGIEAMACHCPIVSTKCGGPADFVRDDDNGYLVEIGDAEEMVRRSRQFFA